MKVLGKVWENLNGSALTVEFYIVVEDEYWKTNSIIVTKVHKHFNLRRLFNKFATRIEYKFHRFKIRGEKAGLMWEREIEVEEEVVVSLMNKKRKEEI